MSIVVAGFDIHRTQITFDALDTETGEVKTGRIPATPEAVAGWVGRFGDREVQVALEACTGWYFVCRALEGAGATPHLAEVAETRARRGPKRRAKTDRADARWLRTCSRRAGCPRPGFRPITSAGFAFAPGFKKTLTDEATAWRQRIQATLFHLGEPALPLALSGDRARRWLAQRELPDAARERIEVSLR